MKSLTIDVFSDVVCPWCFVGTRRLKAVLASLDEPVDVSVRYHAFELSPGTPPEGRNVHEELRRKYGNLDALFARVEAAAREAGIPLDARKQAMSYPTIAAHTLLRHAAARGTQEALADALFTAHFLEARNIADTSVLVELASKHGFDADEARALLRDEEELAATREGARKASEMGITGVPFFIFNRKLAFSGAQSEETFRGAIAKALE